MARAEKSAVRAKRFRQTAKIIFESQDGKEVLSYLKAIYVDETAVDSTPELTYYKLGQKELIQGLIALLKEPEGLDDINNQYLLD